MNLTRIAGASLMALLTLSCGGETPPVNVSKSAATPANVSPEQVKPRAPRAIDVLKLADKTTAELDRAFGPPDEAKPTGNGGQYRLYKVNGHSRGLAVRFYGDRAKEFNLILDRPIPSAKEALKSIFGIDVGAAKPSNDSKEPLSETYRGTFGGVRFSKVSAKREENGDGFIFVLAQVAR